MIKDAMLRNDSDGLGIFGKFWRPKSGKAIISKPKEIVSQKSA